MRVFVHDRPPLGEGFRTSLLVAVPTGEVAFLIEEVVDWGVNRGELL